jgi:tape measure domain-containing protein
MAVEEWVIVRLRMQDAQRFITQAKAAGASVRMMGEEANKTSAAWHYLGGRGFWLNQVFFTIRRVVYGLSIAMAGLAAVSIKMGFNFQSSMQQARVALQPVAGDIGGVNKELNYLFNFTKYTPFQFKDMTIAFRQMYLGMRTVGVSAQTVNTTLKSMVDALAATGKTSPMNLNRVAIALQHMAFQGRLTGFAVNQLARDGIPIFAALHKEMGLTGDQLHNISKLGIPAQATLDALNRYIESTPGFMNAARRQALGTFHGLFTTFKDNLAQLFGIMEAPLFPKLMGWTRSLNKVMGDLADTAKRTHGNIDSVLKTLDAHIGHGVDLAGSWKALQSVLVPLGQILFEITGDFIKAWAALSIGQRSATPLAGILRTLLWLIQHLGFVLVPLISLWFAERTAVLLVAAAKKTLILWTWAEAFATRAAYLAEIVYITWVYRAAIAEAFLTNATIILFGAQVALRMALYGAAAAAEGLWVALLSNPIGLIGAAMVVLIGGLIILYFKWQRFHDAVNATVDFLRTHWYLIALIPVIGPFLMIVTIMANHFQRLVGWLKDIVHWIRTAIHWFNKIPHPHIPGSGIIGHVGLAAGGDVTHGGWFTVGERGPELAYLPAGSAVRPIAGAPVQGALTGQGMPGELVVHSHLHLDGKHVAESTDRYRLDKLARQ